MLLLLQISNDFFFRENCRKDRKQKQKGLQRNLQWIGKETIILKRCNHEETSFLSKRRDRREWIQRSAWLACKPHRRNEERYTLKCTPKRASGTRCECSVWPGVFLPLPALPWQRQWLIPGKARVSVATAQRWAGSRPGCRDRAVRAVHGHRRLGGRWRLVMWPHESVVSPHPPRYYRWGGETWYRRTRPALL